MTTLVITSNSAAQNAVADQVVAGVEYFVIRQANPDDTYTDFGGFGFSTIDTLNQNCIIKASAAALSNVPVGATINSVTLALNASFMDWVGTDPRTVFLREMLKASVNNQATWNNAATGDPWNAAGANGSGTDFDPTAVDSVSVSKTTPQWVLFDITAAYDSLEIGFSPRNDGTLAEELVFSSNTDTDLLRPEIIIDYTAGGGGGNNAPTDIALSNSSISAGAGANAVVGMLSTVDADGGDTHTYTLVAGLGDDDNASFNILGDQLRCTDPAALGAGSYSVRIQTSDGTDTYQETFGVTITAGATTINDVSSSAGADTAALNSQLTITVVDNTGVTGVTVNGVALTSVVADGDGVTVTANVGLGVNANIGGAVDVIVNNGQASAAYSVTVALPSGFSSVALTAAYADLPLDSSFYGESAYSTLDVGDVWIYDNIAGTITYDSELVVTADPALVADTDVDGWFLEASESYAADASITTDHLTVGNNAPTDIALSNSTIAETGGANSVVGTLSTTDADGGDSHTYSLVAGTGSTNNGSFNISGNQLRCTNPAALGAGTYSVRIQSSDGTDVYAEAFTITLTAAPNNAPTDITLSANAILETAGANSVVGTLSTVDADGGDSHTYNLVAGTGDAHNASFNILGDQLRCTDPAALGVGSYSVRVQTNDGQATFAKAFTVNISAAGSDVTPPVISDPGALTVIVPAGTTSVERAHPTIQAWIASVTATDETGPANPVVTHNIPVSINVAQSPFTAIFSATDTAGNVGQRSRTITITEAAGATLAVTESGRKGRFEQRDAAWYRIE